MSMSTGTYSHKPGDRLPLFAARLAVTYKLQSITVQAVTPVLRNTNRYSEDF